jgi:hypothetical protein
MADYYCARESFATQYEGGPVVVRKGENVRADHPLVRANPEKFAPVELSSRWDTVEQATAAPGEKRQLGRKPISKLKETGSNA